MAGKLTPTTNQVFPPPPFSLFLFPQPFSHSHSSDTKPTHIQTGGSGFYTAAGSNALFAGSNASSTWCGSGCGTCYKLTSTGSSPSGEGAGGVDGQSITVMVTNLCPYSGNQNWCPQRFVLFPLPPFLFNTSPDYSPSPHFHLLGAGLKRRKEGRGWIQLGAQNLC